MERILRKLFIPFVLIVIASAPLVSFLEKGLPMGHDAQDHVVRIANFYASLSEGVVFPQWGANLNWGYGHPVLMFLYPFSSYLASLFHTIGLSFVDSTKAVFIFSYIASVLSMYLFLQAMWGKRVGVVGALLYGFAPYRFVDMYVRMAIGEHAAFIFPPLVCYFIYKLSRLEWERGKMRGEIKQLKLFGAGLSLATAGMILSHNAISLIMMPVFILFGYYTFQAFARKRLEFLFTACAFVGFGFALSSFYWIPAFFEGKYTLRTIVTAGGISGRFVPLLAFFSPSWSYGGTDTLSKNIGFVQWLGIFASGVYLLKAKDRTYKSLIVSFLFLFVCTLFMMTEKSEWVWDHVMILQNFQFPWRLLSLSVFLSSIIGGLTIAYVERDAEKYIVKKAKQAHVAPISTGIFAFLMIGIVFTTAYMWKPRSYQIEDESFYTRVYPGTTDTGESSPIWTTRFMEQFPPSPIEVISGAASVTAKERKTTRHTYEVNATTKAELLENTIYFPGWTVKIDGQTIQPEFQSLSHRGILTFWVEPGIHQVEVTFEQTKLRSVAFTISLISGIMLLFITAKAYIWNNARH